MRVNRGVVQTFLRGRSPAARGQRGFSFIELLAVVAAISILAAFSVPHLNKVKMSTQEKTAAASLRALYSGEVLYQARFGSYGGLSDLMQLEFVDDSFSTGLKNGYSYSVSNFSQHTFEIVAVPIHVGVSGTWGFFVDETGVIRYTEDGSPPNENSATWN